MRGIQALGLDSTFCIKEQQFSKPLFASPLYCQLTHGIATAEHTLPLQVLLDCIVLDLDVFHDSPETLDGIIQSGYNARGSKLTESEQQHQSEGLDIVMVLESIEDSLDEGG
jgi:hypothetical protein